MGELSAQDVNFRYPAARTFVVEGWSHTFHPGTVTAMTGASGCGKSTRLYLLALMTRITEGQIVLDGQRVDNLSDPERARIRASRFGFIFQDAALDATRSVLDNVVESCLYRGERPANARTRAAELLERMNVGVPLDRKPGQISGGQAQRIALARALIGQPDVVFADEPTGNLDAESSDVVLGMLREQADQGAAVIIVTHDPGLAQRADVHLSLSAPSLAIDEDEGACATPEHMAASDSITRPVSAVPAYMSEGNAQ
ncbi:ABC transporter ATP-binding protein [Schaalia sp. ZJ405]|uniref:ABC transporter ATP-binding protein n=1 Tax=Schaalia sp. ZJ405 TaxID=2709403 RepID=UPI001E3E7967|nr:ABC transporter ATP-binding protein [Schaalia sp. ZJ405]